MTKDEALRLALEALEMFCEHGAILRPIETRDAIKATLEAKDEPCCYGGIAHDCHAGKGCQIAERLKTSAKVKDEPVAVIDSTISGHIDWLCTFFPKQGTPLYTAPPQRKPLTDEKREEIAKGWRGRNWTVGDIIDAVEAAHGIKGEA